MIRTQGAAQLTGQHSTAEQLAETRAQNNHCASENTTALPFSRQEAGLSGAGVELSVEIKRTSLFYDFTALNC